MYKENTIVELTAVRESDIGVFLDAGTGKTSDDILLHHDQQKGEIRVGDKVRVFLYHDPKGRLTASMRLPRLKEGQIAYVPVINRTAFGAFVDVGTERGIFLPFSEMRGNVQTGDMVWVKLYSDKTGRLAVTMDVNREMNLIAKPANNLVRGDLVTLAIYDIGKDGALGISPQKYIGFIHKDEWDGKLKVGEKVCGRVTFVREDGRINVSLRAQKEQAIKKDADKIVAYLKEHNGCMVYNDKSDAEVIRLRFGISKAAFKRALGSLMKQGIVIQEKDTTRLV